MEAFANELISDKSDGAEVYAGFGPVSLGASVASSYKTYRDKIRKKMRMKTQKQMEDDGAVFSLQIKDSSGKFYNFKTKTFTSAFVSENVLRNISISGFYNGAINFPAAGSGDTYTIYLFTVSFLAGRRPPPFNEARRLVCALQKEEQEMVI